MALADEGTPLFLIQELYGGETLPDLKGALDGTRSLNELVEAVKILNGVTDEALTMEPDMLPKGQTQEDILNAAQGPSVALAHLIFYFVKASSAPAPEE